MTTEQYIEDLKTMNERYDDPMIIKAFEIANRLHNGQMRKSGEPYIIHPIAVSKILASFGMDNETVVAGLLHDVVEDTEYTR
ncbi:MAG: HD domain-containing protein, partial [Clostridia bacterium]|nr:HD domain-containing protein [Clostridia bacterium]